MRRTKANPGNTKASFLYLLKLVYIVVKDLENKLYKEQLRELGLLTLKKRKLRRNLFIPYIYLKLVVER